MSEYTEYSDFQQFSPAWRDQLMHQCLCGILSAVEALPSAPAYLVYRALISQDGTDAPTAIVLENTLGEVPTFTYVDVGVYELNTVGNVFTTNKTFVMMNAYSTGNDTAVVTTATKNAVNLIDLHSYVSNVGTNGVLVFTEIQILVYP